MGDETGNHQSAGVAAGKAALLARSSIWKSAIVIAPLAATALFLASGTQAQTSGSAPLSASVSANGPVAPIETTAAARRKGPKIKEKTATDTSRVASPSPTEPTTSTPVAPIDAPEAARRKGPKERDKVPTSRVESPAPSDAAVEARRKGPKGAGSSDAQGRTEAPPPASTPSEERRRNGPKGDGSSDAAGGRTEAPAPDTQPAVRRKEGPKGDGSHGRTATTPLIIGALSAAAVLALVVSGGNDRPASP